MIRVGSGLDVHRLVEKRPLVLGGVHIDYHLGLDGHSDADVLIHALIDALLGAAGMRDIGYFFPPDDEQYRGADSMQLLGQVQMMLNEAHWKLVNVDLLIIAEMPKMASYIEQMRKNIAEKLAVAECRVAVKATTTEGLGFCGRGEGIAAQATVLIEKAARQAPAKGEAD